MTHLYLPRSGTPPQSAELHHWICRFCQTDLTNNDPCLCLISSLPSKGTLLWQPWVNIRIFRAQDNDMRVNHQVFCFLQMDRHTDHFIDFCLWGHSLTYDFFMDLIFFFWTSLNFYEKNNCVALCCNTVLKIQSIYTNWGQKYRNYGKNCNKVSHGPTPHILWDIIPLTSENTALS